MSHAPVVACLVRRSRFAGALMLGLWLCGVLAAGRFAADAGSAAGSGWRLALIVTALLGCGAYAAFQWLHAPRGTLRWDGQDWWWQPHGGSDRAGSPSLRLDLQNRLLVHWSDPVDARDLWFWLNVGAVENAAAWHALRCALHARSTAPVEAQADHRAPTVAAARTL